MNSTPAQDTIYILYELTMSDSDTGHSTRYGTDIIGVSRSNSEIQQWLDEARAKYIYGYYRISSAVIGAKPKRAGCRD